MYENYSTEMRSHQSDEERFTKDRKFIRAHLPACMSKLLDLSTTKTAPDLIAKIHL